MPTTPRRSRQLRGPYAMFFLGHVHDPDEPFFVGHQPSDLLHAADGMWGPGWAFAGLWASADDRAHTLTAVHAARAAKLASEAEKQRVRALTSSPERAVAR